MTPLASHIANAPAMPVRRSVLCRVRRHLLDTLAAMLSGRFLPAGEIGYRLAKAQAQSGAAKLLGSRTQGDTELAAFANAMAAHADETDDSHTRGRLHSGCAIVPAALAAAEEVDAPSDLLLKAIALGYDIGARSTMALGYASLKTTVFSTHSIGALFGASAAAAGVIHGLRKTQAKALLSLTVQQASGPAYWNRAPDYIKKAFDFGAKAARNGVFAAQLARARMTTPDLPIAGPNGYLQAFAENARPEALTEKLGERFEIECATIKKWPVGWPIQSVLDCAEALFQGNAACIDKIASLKIRVPANRFHIIDNRDMPAVCCKHAVAVALSDGKVGFEALHDRKHMKATEILAWRKKIALLPDENLSQASPERQSIATVEMADGTKRKHHAKAVRPLRQPHPARGSRREGSRHPFGLSAERLPSFDRCMLQGRVRDARPCRGVRFAESRNLTAEQGSVRLTSEPRNTCPDVLIAGGGNAALCAAITAAEAGVSVSLLESAPKPYRGGNSRHTRNFRCAHSKPMGMLEGQYGEDEYFDDLLKVTKGQTEEDLARMCIRASEEAYGWMESHGVRFQPPLSGTLSLSRTNAFFLGGGKSLVNAFYRRAEALGVEIAYDAEVVHLERDGLRIKEVFARVGGKSIAFYPKAVVAASGGFQANIDWLEQAWGKAARNFLIRGTPYNRGVVLKSLLDQGIESVGDPAQCHAVAIDGRAPEFDGGIVTRLDCVPFSVVVNKLGDRFYDEGEDVWPKRYAIWGRLVAAQPDQVGYAIIDAKSLELFMPSVFPPFQADTIEGLAKKMNLPALRVKQTIEAFNSACRPGAFYPTELDGLATSGLAPPKTNWARAITDPPFFGYELRPGVTFTYLGLRVDQNAQVQTLQGPVENLWAAGEIMAGSILGQGYLAGIGMTIGTVFGRIAGKGSASHVK